MRDLLGDGMREALVQRMADGPGIECIVAVGPHDVFGPVISVGIGGIVADRLRQRPRRALPLTEQDACDLVAEAPIAQVLHDRGLDVDSLVDIVRRMAALADAVHELTGLRCNPILVSSTGSAVLSARVAVRPTPTEHLPVRRL